MKKDKTVKKQFIPRGQDALLPHGGLPESISLHLMKLIEKTGGINGPIGRQFVAQKEKEQKYYSSELLDPLVEDEHEVAPGVVYKYQGKLKSDGQIASYGRVLWTITRFCASYCRFCTRGREVGMPPGRRTSSKATIAQKTFLDDTDINEVFAYLERHREINEVIISGGDPLTAPQGYLSKIILGLARLQKNGQLDIIRLGTRLPIHNPLAIKDWHYELFAKIRNPYLMVHINHPAELTPESLEVLRIFRRRALATVMSQTVLLAGVNDSEEILIELFNTLAKEGIRPYYVFQNDPVYWAKHFTVPIKKAIALWGSIRPKLSGVAATARFVIDAPYGFGKIPIPEGNAWEFDLRSYTDFSGKKHQLDLENS